MSPVIITIVGGGVFVPRLCEALARTVDCPEVHLRLSARRAERLQVLADHGARRVAPARPGWSVQAAPSLEDSVEGATIVVLLVRVGGFEARAWDETFPRGFGLAGDEGLGPGGIANAWRTVPELARIARTLQRVAPAARVINLMAPLGITTRLLLDHGLDALGLCELPLVTIESWLAAAGATVDATWRYGGLNHLGWFWDVLSHDLDVLRSLAGVPVLPRRLAPLDQSTLELYQAAPLRYFYEIFDRDAGRKLGLERPADRARQLSDLSDTLVQRFSETPGAEIPEAEARPTPWLDRAVAPIISALLDGPRHSGFVNLRNEGRIPELPAELVVELAATFSSGGADPENPGPLPDRVAHFLRSAGHSEALSFLAADRRDPGLLSEAIRALPLQIPEATVRELTKLAQER